MNIFDLLQFVQVKMAMPTDHCIRLSCSINSISIRHMTLFSTKTNDESVQSALHNHRWQ